MPGLVIKEQPMNSKINENLTTPPVMNPHSPAANGYRQQPVEIPGVLHQTRQLFQPVTMQPPPATPK
jgi:hypothetical protein